MPRIPKTKFGIDYLLVILVGALLLYGLSALYSASTVEAYNNTGDTAFYLKRQLMQGVSVGLLGMLVLSKINYRLLIKYTPFILAISLLLLITVKVTDFSGFHGGATRWLDIGPVRFQPSEFAKLGLIIYLAAWIERKGRDINKFKTGLLPALLIVVLFAGLILWQPDLGTALVFIAVSLGMLFSAGMLLRHFTGIVAIGIGALALLIKLEPYRFNRILTFFNPSMDPQGISYQVNQAMLAIGSGGWWGYGYGMSRQKHNYLPEAIGDSIFAVTAEELGFIRITLLILLFLALAFKGLSLAKKAPDAFGRSLAIGITTWIIFQAFINIAAMLHLVPLTGIPLPFFSYGSSSLTAILWGVGILFSISRVNRGQTQFSNNSR